LLSIFESADELRLFRVKMLGNDLEDRLTDDFFCGVAKDAGRGMIPT
jgi:hypothetical protein